MASASSLAARSVYIRIKPVPRCLHESKGILRAIQKFGEVTTFRSFRFEKKVHAPNIALAIFQNPRAAGDLIQSSPLPIEVPPPTSGSSDSSPENFTIVKFSLTITPSYYNHTNGAIRNAYSGRWKANTNTVPYKDLLHIVPVHEYADCVPAMSDLDDATIHVLRQEVAAEDTPMAMWRRGMQSTKEGKPEP